MDKWFRFIGVACWVNLAVLVSGCVQMPTENTKVVDLRPQISFNVEKENVFSARVSVDGLDVGAVGDYVAGKSSLRVLPGNHRIQVIGAGVLLLDEKTYLGDGVSRSFVVR